MTTKIFGITLQPHSTTYGLSGIEKTWTADALEDAAPTLAGCDVYNSTRHGPQDLIGEVVYSEYREDSGVYYEAEIMDEDAVAAIEAGYTRMAPMMEHDVVPDDVDEPFAPEEIEFTGLFVASHPTHGVPNNPDRIVSLD